MGVGSVADAVEYLHSGESLGKVFQTSKGGKINLLDVLIFSSIFFFSLRNRFLFVAGGCVHWSYILQENGKIVTWKSKINHTLKKQAMIFEDFKLCPLDELEIKFVRYDVDMYQMLALIL